MSLVIVFEDMDPFQRFEIRNRSLGQAYVVTVSRNNLHTHKQFEKVPLRFAATHCRVARFVIAISIDTVYHKSRYKQITITV